ncbi:MAG: DsbA family protein [Rhizobiales bacterium]|nr:DsbA family protein [Hyphomicrobiales bacterium]
MRYIFLLFLTIFLVNEADAASRLEQLYLESQLINNYSDDLYFNETDFVIGNEDAEVTVVEFFDYNCGYCERALADLIKLIDSNSNIKVVLKEYPILNDNSYDLAKLSLSAGLQGKYFEFHSILLSTKGTVSYDQALKIAADIGLDILKLEDDFKSQQVNDIIANTKVLGYSLAVSGTPAYFVGDIKLPGAVGYETLQEVVNYITEGISIDDYIVQLAQAGDSDAYKVMVRYGLY